MPGRRGTWRRRLAWMLLAAALAAIAVPVAIVLSLRIESVQDRALVRISEKLERETGTGVRARGFDLDAWRGVIEIRGLEVASAGHSREPFLTAPFVRCELDLPALLRGHVVVRGLTVDRPRLLLDAPLPPATSDSASPLGFLGDLEIRSFELRGGEIPAGGPGAPGVASLGPWQLSDLDVRGSVSNGRAAVVLSRASLHVEPVSRPVNLVLEGSLAIAKDGAFEVEALKADGSGISLDARGSGGVDPGLRVSATYRLDTELARLAADLFAGGSIAVSGQLDIGGGSGPRGTARVEATGVPLDALERWVALDLPPPLVLRGTRADGKGDFEFDLSNVGSLAALRGDAIRGEASLSWLRGGTRLLDASVRSEPETPPSAEGVARCSLRAALFPEAEGERRLEGTARIRSWGDPAGIDILGATLHAREPRIPAALDRLGVPVPWPDAAAPGGSLDATVEASGPLVAPRFRLDATWRDESETLAVVSARSAPGWRAWPPARIAVDVDASVLPEAPGARQASVRLEGLELRDGTARVDLPDLGQAVADLLRRTGVAIPSGSPRLDELLSGPFEAEARFSGKATKPLVAIDSAWHPGGEGIVRLTATGRPNGQAPFFDLAEDAKLEARDVDASRFGAPGLVVHSLDAVSDGKRVSVRSIAATLPPASPGALRGELSGSGGFDLAWPPRLADADLSIEHPIEGVDRASVRAQLDGGVVRIDRLDVDSGSSRASARGSIPLAALARYAGPLRELLAGYPYGPIALEAEGIDLGALQRALPLPDTFPRTSGTVDVRLALDPERPMSSSGRLEARGLALELDGRRIAAEGPVRIDLDNGKATLPATPLRSFGPNVPAGLPAELSGTVELSQDWVPGQGPASLIRDFSAALHGTIDAAALTRFLGTGNASGALVVDASARGPLGGVAADVEVRGPDARISFLSPYATRFESPEARFHFRGGALEIESARFRWNSGELTVRGTIAPRRDSRVAAEFDGVTYRLEYGVTARLGGQLELVWPAEGDRVLRGALSVDRATLRRNVSLDREMLRSLFEPAGAAESALLETVLMDLQVTTVQGLQIRNNVASLHADWDPLHVTGSLAAPKISGQARVVPGGLLNLFGSIVRIDEGTFSWSGDPPSSPRVALKTTSAVEDPTIKNQWYSSWYAAPVMGPGRGGTMDLTAQRASSAETMDAFASGMMSYYQDRLAGSVGGGVTQTELSYEPLPLFGETDTTARMTITQRLSRYAKFVASYNPTDAEAQTFVLEAHGLDAAPSLAVQAFENDEKHQGGTLQQTVRLGKGYLEDESADRLRKVRIDAPEGISKRKLKKNISYRPGDALPDGSAMDAEFDVVDGMRRLGYPLSEVSVEAVPHSPKKVDLEVRVVPGPKIRCEFEGDRPRKAARRVIAALYRFGEEEAASLEEIRQETVRALQSRGYLDPRVEVSVMREGAGGEGEPLTVRVQAEGGRTADPDAPSFAGVPSKEASALSSLFATKDARIALAAGAPAADLRVRRALAAAGYPDARVAGRELSEDGRKLVVRVEPGGRQRLAGIAVRGLPPGDEQRLLPLLGLREGDPVEAEKVAGAVVVVERDMMSKGHAQSDIRARLEPVSPDRLLDRNLIIDASPGPEFEIGDVRFRGARTSRPGWLESTAGLSSGTPADPQEISKARSRLAQTGVFQEIRVSTDPPTTRSARAGEAAEPDRTIPTAVLFDLAEKKRWQLAYGGRYETEVGFGVMVNLDNFNSLGRGQTTGLRGVYAANDQEIQLYHVVPRLFGERSSLEGFLQYKRELTEGVWSEGEQAWLQASFPLTKRWRNRTYVVFEWRTLTSEEPDTPLDQRAISPRVGWQLVYDSRVLPSMGIGRSKGFFYGLNLVGSTEAIGSDLTGLGTYQQWSHYLPLGDPERGRFDWAHSYRVSTIDVKGESVPTDSRLRAGGEFSVRGYPTNSLGPQDEEGNALGGEFLVIANEEMHVRLWRSFSSLLFVDVGNVWPTLGGFDWRFSASYGLGLRWSSPIGPLRFDWAVPINPRPNDPGQTFYLGFGNVF